MRKRTARSRMAKEMIFQCLGRSTSESQKPAPRKMSAGMNHQSCEMLEKFISVV